MSTTLDELQGAADDAMRAGELDIARRTALQVLASYPASLWASRLLAEVFARQGRAAEALEQFQLVVGADPLDIPAYMAMAELAHSLQLADARRFEFLVNEHWSGALGPLAPLPESITVGRLGILQARSQLWPQAIESLNRAIAADDSRLDLYLLLARCLYMMRQFDQAEGVVATILSASEDCLEANVIAAAICRRLARADDAEAFLERAYGCDPSGARIREMLMVRDLGPDVSGRRLVTLAVPEDLLPSNKAVLPLMATARDKQIATPQISATGELSPSHDSTQGPELEAPTGVPASYTSTGQPAYAEEPSETQILPAGDERLERADAFDPDHQMSHVDSAPDSADRSEETMELEPIIARNLVTSGRQEAVGNSQLGGNATELHAEPENVDDKSELSQLASEDRSEDSREPVETSVPAWEPVAEAVSEPVAEAVPEPVAEAVSEPVNDAPSTAAAPSAFPDFEEWFQENVLNPVENESGAGASSLPAEIPGKPEEEAHEPTEIAAEAFPTFRDAPIIEERRPAATAAQYEFPPHSPEGIAARAIRDQTNGGTESAQTSEQAGHRRWTIPTFERRRRDEPVRSKLADLAETVGKEPLNNGTRFDLALELEHADPNQAVAQYAVIVGSRDPRLVTAVRERLETLLATGEKIHGLQRLLGDVCMQQGTFERAIECYSLAFDELRSRQITDRRIV